MWFFFNKRYWTTETQQNVTCLYYYLYTTCIIYVLNTDIIPGELYL